MKIDVRGGVLGATEVGSGQPLVLLHSLLADRGSFDRIVGPLSTSFRVVTLELPGFGDSSPMGGGLVDFAERIAEGIRQVAGEEQPIVLGNGFGAFISLQLAIDYPEFPARLVLADGGAAFSEDGRAAFRNMVSGASAKGLEAIAEVAMRRLFAPEFQAENPRLMAERRRAFLQTDLGVFQAACQALATLDLRASAATMRVPTLVLVGEEDEATPPAMSEELAALLPDARFKLLPGCAHVPQLQRPEVFLDAISEFLRS